MSFPRELFHTRLNVLWIALYLAVGFLGLRLLQIQVLRNVLYAKAAERNRTQVIRQTAPRGRIFDRNGEVIATNQAVFSLIYMPDKNREMSYLTRLARDLAPHLKEDPENLLKILHQAMREESAIRLAEKLPSKVMFKLSELRTIYPGVDLIVEARRFYPHGAFAAHLLGHMGKIDEASWKRLKREGYRVDSWVGKAGLERILENELRGQDGGIRMEVDVRGRLKRVLEQIQWKPGSNVVLTIDAKLQKVAEEALRSTKSKAGAVVALDPRNGKVLALASVPDFDPNLFLVPEAADVPVKLRDIPAFNLALQGSYPPGSIFKFITGAAMFNEGKIDPEEKVFCPGHFELGNRVVLCWEPKGHRYKDWLGGLANSCDVYFYKMGLKIGAELIEKYEHIFGLGKPTKIGLAGESAGNIFGPHARKKRPWYDGDTVNLSIGQGELLVTPIQMAVMIGAIANRGTLWRPHFIEKIEYIDGRPAYVHKPEVLSKISMKDSTWDLMHAAAKEVIRDGTGRQVGIPGLVIGGKTGTAENPGKDDHAWFVAYAGRPGEQPSLALSVLAQHGGHGAEAAGPIAKKLIQTVFDIEPPKPAAPPAALPAAVPAEAPAVQAVPVPIQVAP